MSAKLCYLCQASVLCPAFCYFTALDGQPRPIQIYGGAEEDLDVVVKSHDETSRFSNYSAQQYSA
eukprot:1585980-Pleurochrysis_carterae.AAC.1